jgi:two-component sensor histidine kinase
LEQLKLDPEQRRQLFLIFKEALHNIARHADCQSVRLRLELNRNKQDWYVGCGQIILNSQLSILNSWQEDAYQACCSLQKN